MLNPTHSLSLAVSEILPEQRSYFGMEMLQQTQNKFTYFPTLYFTPSIQITKECVTIKSHKRLSYAFKFCDYFKICLSGL